MSYTPLLCIGCGRPAIRSQMILRKKETKTKSGLSYPLAFYYYKCNACGVQSEFNPDVVEGK